MQKQMLEQSSDFLRTIHIVPQESKQYFIFS